MKWFKREKYEVRDDEQLERLMTKYLEADLPDIRVLDKALEEMQRNQIKANPPKDAYRKIKWAAAIAACVVVAVLAVTFAMFNPFGNDNNPTLYSSEDDLIEQEYTSIQDYNAEYGKNYLYFDVASIINKCNLYLNEDNSVIYVKNLLTVNGDSINFYVMVAPDLIDFDSMFLKYLDPQDSIVIKDTTFSYNRVFKDNKYFYYISFEYEEAKYLIEVKTVDPNNIQNYLETLIP